MSKKYYPLCIFLFSGRRINVEDFAVSSFSLFVLQVLLSCSSRVAKTTIFATQQLPSHSGHRKIPWILFIPPKDMLQWHTFAKVPTDFSCIFASIKTPRLPSQKPSSVLSSCIVLEPCPRWDMAKTTHSGPWPRHCPHPGEFRGQDPVFCIGTWHLSDWQARKTQHFRLKCILMMMMMMMTTLVMMMMGGFVTQIKVSRTTLDRTLRQISPSDSSFRKQQLDPLSSPIENLTYSHEN